MKLFQDPRDKFGFSVREFYSSFLIELAHFFEVGQRMAGAVRSYIEFLLQYRETISRKLVSIVFFLNC